MSSQFIHACFGAGVNEYLWHLSPALRERFVQRHESEGALIRTCVALLPSNFNALAEEEAQELFDDKTAGAIIKAIGHSVAGRLHMQVALDPPSIRRLLVQTVAEIAKDSA